MVLVPGGQGDNFLGTWWLPAATRSPRTNRWGCSAGTSHPSFAWCISVPVPREAKTQQRKLCHRFLESTGVPRRSAGFYVNMNIRVYLSILNYCKSAVPLLLQPKQYLNLDLFGLCN